MSVQNFEQYVLDAEKAFAQELYLEGKAYLEHALAEEPAFAKAHNHLGWLYLYHMVDYEKAERHLKLALKYAKQYSAPYFHMLDLLYETERLEEHEKLIAVAMNVPGVRKSFLYNEIGRNREVTGKVTEAIKNYRLAIRWSMETKEIEVIKENIRRARSKRWLFLNI